MLRLSKWFLLLGLAACNGGSSGGNPAPNPDVFGKEIVLSTEQQQRIQADYNLFVKDISSTCGSCTETGLLIHKATKINALIKKEIHTNYEPYQFKNFYQIAKQLDQASI